VRKVLIANRGEIAVRVARACRDAGISSVAVYADSDRDAPHVRAADEAFSLGGDTPASSYLDMGKVLDVAARSGAEAVHPGYGFLSENANFAQAVMDAGLIWIGPPPDAIRSLGDKVQARHIAQAVNAPQVAGTPDPVSGADEVVAFAKQHGLPIAIKAAFGGGGRGLKVATTIEEIPELYDSAVREAVSASSSATSTARVTSRPSASPTSTATSLSSRRATAHYSGATRSSSKRPQHRSSPLSRTPSSTVRPRPSCARPDTSGPAPASSSSVRTARSPSSR
jgi:acetyl/propionyl-CoA carboxylase alpha subunit